MRGPGLSAVIGAASQHLKAQERSRGNRFPPSIALAVPTQRIFGVQLTPNGELSAHWLRISEPFSYKISVTFRWSKNRTAGCLRRTSKRSLLQ